MFCVYCGKVVSKEDETCPNCGTPVIIPEAPPPMPIPEEEQYPYLSPNALPSSEPTVPIGMKQKDKWTALKLCFFLGLLGAHRFYEGKKTSAFLWLFTGGFFGVGYIVDLIILFCKPNPYYV